LTAGVAGGLASLARVACGEIERAAEPHDDRYRGFARAMSASTRHHRLIDQPLLEHMRWARDAAPARAHPHQPADAMAQSAL